MCHACYQFWYRHNPGLAKRPSLAERFWAKVDQHGPGDCWEWLASRQNQGYGQFGRGGRAGGMTLAHRMAYELAVGPIPAGLVIDHLCRNRTCCNPAHLEAVRQRINVYRGIGNATKTHCKHGHEFDLLNTYYERGARRCLSCRRERDRRRPSGWARARATAGI